MKNRILTSIIGIPIVLYLLYLSRTPLKIFLIIASIIAFKELFTLLFKNVDLFSFEFIISVLTTIFIFYTEKFETIIVLFIVSAVYYVTKNYKEQFVSSISLLLFAFIYSVCGFFFIYLIRDNFGFATVMFLITATWICDSSAYFSGTKYGKKKLAPEISPNKSIEGAVGGLIATVIWSIIYYILFSKHLQFSIITYIILSIIIGMLGQIGDLFESLLKRKYDVKDSGELLPGHGGILDRCDSLIFNSFFVYIVLSLL